MSNSCFSILAICIASLLLLLEMQECRAFGQRPIPSRIICTPPKGPKRKCISGTPRPTAPPYRPPPPYPYGPPIRPPGGKLKAADRENRE
uniref:Uncharacterized protein n=1 Tax=Rhipicephalus appendiculatus TaxID=34631 RepID=A0A131YF73_RHIAP